MDNINNTQNYQDQVMPEQMENMYPEIYNDIYPLVVQSVDDIMRSGYMPTDEAMNYYVDNIIKNSGMWDEDDDISVTAQSAFDPQFRRRRRRRHHNRNTLRDITRILLLRELRERNRRRR